MTWPGEDLIIELRSVSKRYANGTLANDGVSFGVRRGEVHAVVGENGAGKSTVMKMLFGLEQPSAGEILLNGCPVVLRSPRDAIAAGIGLVPQHLELVTSFTVAENVVLGCEPIRRGVIDRRRAAEAVRQASERFGLAVKPDAIVGDLSVGEQQRVEILKTLYRGAQVVLLDEPSAVLPPQETDALFKALRQLVDNGLTVVLITHKLAEVREVSDRFTVMRAGRVTGHAASRAVGAGEIADMIVGRPLAPLQLSRSTRPRRLPLLAVRDLALTRPDGSALLQGVSFDIASGEILGVAGVEGNGQAPLAALLGGLESPTRGSAALEGDVFTGHGVRGARAGGVAVVPEDRLRDGVAASMSIVDNFIAAEYHQPPLSRRGWLDTAIAYAKTQQMLREFGVVARSADTTIGSLSGGNMQKVVLAREVSGEPRLLVASQPTRGVDVGAAQALRRHIAELANRGAAVLLFSADLDELLDLSDRIAVLFRGRIAAHFAAKQVGAHELGLYMTGLRHDDKAAALLDSPFTARAEESAA